MIAYNIKQKIKLYWFLNGSLNDQTLIIITNGLVPFVGYMMSLIGLVLSMLVVSSSKVDDSKFMSIS